MVSSRVPSSVLHQPGETSFMLWGRGTLLGWDLLAYHIQQLGHGFRRLRAHTEPVLCPGGVKLDVLVPFWGGRDRGARAHSVGGGQRRVAGRGQRYPRDRVVRAEDFDGFLAARGFGLREDDVVDGRAFGAEAGEPDS